MSTKNNVLKYLFVLFAIPLLLFIPTNNNSAEASSSLIATAKKYIGTPYKWGGTTPSGFDCSGYIQYVFKEEGISLPRTTGGQYNVGTPVAKGNLRAGDLVFFGTGSITHAGIMVDGTNFIHSSTSRGVMISSIYDPYYWGSRYYGAKRVANFSAKSGWELSGGKWYYYQGGSTAKGWIQSGSKWYYTNNSGVMQTGWTQVGSKWYYLNGSGVMQTGWTKVNNKWYYLNGSGEMQTAWTKVNSQWYYLNGSGEMQTGWEKVNNEWYYLNGSGVMQTAWTKVSNDWYYLNGSGQMQTGWEKVSNDWYYLNGSGQMQTGWEKVRNDWYYLNGSGVMQTAWEKVNNQWYYLNGSGQMQTGWLDRDKEKTYYLNDGKDGTLGAMEIDWTVVEGDWYHMNPNSQKGTLGAVTKATTIDDRFVVDKDGKVIEDLAESAAQAQVLSEEVNEEELVVEAEELAVGEKQE